MVEASKFWFERTCSGSDCRDLIHPWTAKCSDANATMLLSCIQILMRGKKLGKKEIIEQFKLYLKSGIFGLTVGSSFVTLNCIFRQLFFSKFSYYTTVLLPCTVSGLAVYFEPPYRRVMVLNLFVNLILASWAYQKGMIPANLPLVELLYCLCQGLLFHARVMHEDVCPRYIVNLMHTVTGAK
ncbi:Uncharacterized protein OBRU01_11686 [Operophtera brumata]|uniref:Transmembrane protein 135 N-terminal domain-containing protein n=1 Tax=Operophtera brumata TaxID=104452 RepID=A0A0L7LBK0_OPEBR|nr:Uncharacterized protein OBRU01_11686 [Operophtera brumata]